MAKHHSCSTRNGLLRKSMVLAFMMCCITMISPTDSSRVEKTPTRWFHRPKEFFPRPLLKTRTALSKLGVKNAFRASQKNASIADSGDFPSKQTELEKSPLVINETFSTAITPVKSRAPSVWSRLGGSTKRFAQKTSSKIINFSDPLHAYPNRFDVLFHRLFHQAAVYEVNHADLVRSIINTARMFSVFSWAATAIAAIAALAVAIPVAVPFGRREDDEAGIEYDDGRPHNWSQIEAMAQTILHAIQNGQLKYNV